MFKFKSDGAGRCIVSKSRTTFFAVRLLGLLVFFARVCDAGPVSSDDDCDRDPMRRNGSIICRSVVLVGACATTTESPSDTTVDTSLEEENRTITSENVLSELSALLESIQNAPTPEKKKEQAEKVQNVILNVADQVFSADKEKNSSNIASEEAKERNMRVVLQAVEGLAPVLASAMAVGERQETSNDYMDIVLVNFDLNETHTVEIENSMNSVRFRPKLPSGQTNVPVAMSVIAGAVGSAINTKVDQENIEEGEELQLNSDIVVVSLANISLLEENVTIQFQLLRSEGFEHPTCVSLAADKNAKLERKGCTPQAGNSSSGYITCSCNHLTSFVVLMRTSEPETTHSLQAESDPVAEMLTVVCLSLSLNFLALAILTFMSFKALICERNTIHVNLSVCLFLAQLLFLVGIDQTHSKTMCAVIAGLLHYLFMAVFAWMAVEGLYLYVKLVVVFDKKFFGLPLFFTIGYGLPAVVVAVSASIFSQGYGTARACWLSKERGFIYSFVGPVLVIVAFNLVMLVLAILVMVRHYRSPSKRDVGRLKRYGEWLKASATLLSVLGVTWLFGISVFVDSGSVVSEYIFIILNGSQGVFLFLFHCLFVEKVRKEYWRVIRRSKLPAPIQLCCWKVLMLGAPGEEMRTFSTFQSTTLKSSPSRQKTDLDSMSQSVNLDEIFVNLDGKAARNVNLGNKAARNVHLGDKASRDVDLGERAGIYLGDESKKEMKKTHDEKKELIAKNSPHKKRRKEIIDHLTRMLTTEDEDDPDTSSVMEELSKDLHRALKHDPNEPDSSLRTALSERLTRTVSGTNVDAISREKVQLLLQKLNIVGSAESASPSPSANSIRT